LRLAAAGGVDLDRLSTVLGQNASDDGDGCCAQAGGHAQGAPLSGSIRLRTSQGKIGEKDLSLAIDFARDAGVPLPLADMAAPFALK